MKQEDQSFNIALETAAQMIEEKFPKFHSNICGCGSCSEHEMAADIAKWVRELKRSAE